LLDWSTFLEGSAMNLRLPALAAAAAAVLSFTGRYG
jgi:hypothetical protein